MSTPCFQLFLVGRRLAWVLVRMKSYLPAEKSFVPDDTFFILLWTYECNFHLSGAILEGPDPKALQPYAAVVRHLSNTIKTAEAFNE